MQDPKSVERLRHGDGATLKRLFKANYASLYPLVYRLTRSREAAEQVIHDAFKQLWDDRKELDPFETIFLRLVSYAHDLAVSYRAENQVSGIEIGARSSRAEEVAQQLEAVPEQDRLMYLLHIIDGYSSRELARAFDMTEDAVRESVGSALFALDKEFEKSLPRHLESSSSRQIWP